MEMTGFGPRVGRQAKVCRKHGSAHLDVRSQANTRQTSHGGTEQDQSGVCLKGFLFCIKRLRWQDLPCIYNLKTPGSLFSDRIVVYQGSYSQG